MLGMTWVLLPGVQDALDGMTIAPITLFVQLQVFVLTLKVVCSTT
jgi:hypothetical protein